MRDFYPEQMFQRRWLEDLWRQVSLRNGFVEYDGPILEHLELLTAKSGQEIVEQLFSLTDRAGRRLAIRPEITPTLARMVNQRVASLPKPIRWFSIPRLCRAEQPQRGRLREFFQWNIDILGVDSAVADAECIFVAVDLLRALGLGPDDVVVRISSRDLLAGLLKDADFSSQQVNNAYRLLDKRRKLSQQVFKQNVQDIFEDEKLAEYINSIANYRTLEEIMSQAGLTSQSRSAAKRLDEVFSVLKTLGVADYCTFDIGIVRGLAYYTGTVFEIFDRAGEFRAIGGGGRFDDLLKALGGPSMPAVGFGIGDVILTEVLAEKGLLPEADKAIEFYVIDADASLFNKLLEIVARLRAAGRASEFSYKRASLGKQLKAAAAAGARRCVIVGQETTDEDFLSIKDMTSGKQKRVELEKFLSDPDQALE